MSLKDDIDLKGKDFKDDEYTEDVDIPGMDSDGSRMDKGDYVIKPKILEKMEIHVRTHGADIDEEEHRKREYFNKIVDEAAGESQIEQGTPVREAEGSLLYRIWSRVNQESPRPKGQVEKKVEYIELFYDLIFVYSLRTINALFHGYEDSFPAWQSILTFVFLTAVVMQVWMFTTMFFNRYGRKALRDYISIFANMYLLYYMASGSNIHWLDHYVRYHTAWALIMANLAYRSWDKLRFAPKLDDIDKDILRNNVVILTFEFVIIAASIPAHHFTGIVISPVALIVGYVGKMKEHSSYARRPCDFPHFAERNLLLVILTFGEMIIGIAGYFTEDSHIAFNIISFLVVIGMFLSYGFFYDNVLDHHKKTSGLGYLIIHVIMILAINSTTIALELLARPMVPIFPKTIWMVITMFIYYICLIMTERYAKEQVKMDYKSMVKIVILMIGYTVLMLLAGHNQLIGSLITVSFVYIVFFMFLHRHNVRLKEMKVGGYIE
ncbi:low temperature requirement protein A [Oribacterium sp. WCC10]|uniref:low temperature requirement protein A n=1 Tax=Oribacterium sp. WCC10 TaxID=1855343 RepID=UPI0008EB44A5|nr:low temperature requirement protein A [Oribacterium sp. WCC10]SFG34609.1 Low temperature requirement protein LtrA [Oribacterium sp. WCC10]